VSELTPHAKDFLYALPMVTEQAQDSFPPLIKELKLRGYLFYQPEEKGTVIALTQSGALALHPDPKCEWHRGGFCGGCNPKVEPAL
jgi:hypothetical protein